MTPQQIINMALKDTGIVGVGQTAQAEDVNDALTKINMMLSQWQRKRWLVYHLIDVPLNCTGAESYTVGTGGDFNTPRPDRLEAAFFRQIVPSQPNLIDYPLTILQAREDYNLIALKTLQTFPQYIFYDAAYPLGSVYPWPVPGTNYQLHLTLKQTLGQFDNLVQDIQLPPEYLNAIHYNLCARLRPAYQLPPDPTITALATDALNLMRNANAQIPRLLMPRVISNSSNYNIYSDQLT